MNRRLDPSLAEELLSIKDGDKQSKPCFLSANLLRIYGDGVRRAAMTTRAWDSGWYLHICALWAGSPVATAIVEWLNVHKKVTAPD
jgi:hypothetical protein